MEKLHWAVQQGNGIVWSSGVSIPELIIQLQYLSSLIACQGNQILSAMIQHLLERLPRRREAIVTAKEGGGNFQYIWSQKKS